MWLGRGVKATVQGWEWGREGKGGEEGDEGGKKCRNEWKIMQFTPVRSVALVSRGNLTDREDKCKWIDVWICG